MGRTAFPAAHAARQRRCLAAACAGLLGAGVAFAGQDGPAPANAMLPHVERVSGAVVLRSADRPSRSAAAGDVCTPGTWLDAAPGASARVSVPTSTGLATATLDVEGPALLRAGPPPDGTPLLLMRGQVRLAWSRSEGDPSDLLSTAYGSVRPLQAGRWTIVVGADGLRLGAARGGLGFHGGGVAATVLGGQQAWLQPQGVGGALRVNFGALEPAHASSATPPDPALPRAAPSPPRARDVTGPPPAAWP